MKPLDIYNRAPSSNAARDEEATALRLAARKLRDAADQAARAKALHLNHTLWSVMLRDLSGSNNRLPPVLKRDCLALALFSVQYSTRAVLSPLPLGPLIEVNERVAEGLEAPAATRPATMPPPNARAPLAVILSA